MEPQRIVVLTQFYPPEVGAAPSRPSYLVNHLAQSGHALTVLTALPNYPAGRIFDGFRGRLVFREQRGPVRIIRTWLYATNSKGFVSRIGNYCSFSVMALLVGSLILRRQDFIIVESPPLFVGLPGFVISRLKRARFCLNISDLWPRSAVVLGAVRSPVLIRWATCLEEFLYRKADVITGQTQGIVDDIVARCKDRTVELMPNGADIQDCPSSGTDVRLGLGIGNQFTVGYTGLHGLAQGLQSIIRAAELLSNFPDIVFLFIGEGPEKANLENMAQVARLTNIRFLPLQPASQMPALFRALDVALVPLKKHPLFCGALPSKLFQAMGAGLPVIGAVEGEARALIEAAHGGICVEPENPDQLADAILRLYKDPQLRKRLGENGRNYVTTHYNRAVTAARFEELLASSLSRQYGSSQRLKKVDA